ncbi:Peroxisomal biogenesis factor 2 [Cyphellophora attinorum]|uniref:Peroxisomal biogenesis factor 2 n=1 Tax=Cyphellophora attinorum TaxID=1664694 RepID=A0A0N1HB10_9EURO|nr:Peroxisomal biogenesis factor 2 [Phialophora attinorum]KPI41153.1 Peroxisomal biogenesis factor 2 [Phialophora attinorum]
MSNSSFAAAQERILQRQADRQRQADARRLAFEEAAQSTPIARLPPPLNRAAPPLTSFWATLVRSEGTRPAFRVGQVDAELLDDELITLLKGQVAEGLKYFGAHLQDDWSQEILLALRVALFKLSIWDNNASYGATLQNLRYADARQPIALQSKPTRWQKSLYGLFTVFGRYGWDRWEDWLIEQEGGYTAPSANVQRLSRITSYVSATHSIAAFTSFLVFLVNGRYRTLVDRILQLRLVSPSNQISREVSFEYLNRQLVWHAFTEFLLFLLPLVGISRWRRWLSRAWKKTKSMVQSEDADGDDETRSKSGPLSFLPERTCAICYQEKNPASSEAEILGANTGASGGIIGSVDTDIVNPYETIPCRCIYCFVCIAGKIEAEEGSGWTCLRCGGIVMKCKPWDGDVLDEQRSSKSVKTVGFSDELEKTRQARKVAVPLTQQM